MIRKILPLALTLLAFLVGAGAGDYLRGGALAEAQATDDLTAAAEITGDAIAPSSGESVATATGHAATASGPASATGETAWFKFPQQFFVPIMRNGRLQSTMVLSLSLELPAGAAEAAYAREVKLRDALLRQLLIHANTGGFDGNFTAEPALRVLRADLVRTAQTVMPEATAVLIGDIARQDPR